MLKYKDNQPIAYKILQNSIDKNSVSHAYILETKMYADSESFILSFVSKIICPTDANHDSGICNTCNMIMTKKYPELKIIETEGIQIKKDEMLELQLAFTEKPVYGKRMVYIIKEAEKLNSSSSNAILKFLEEPEDGITAILVTKNRYQLLETIQSRCQVITLNDNPQNENMTSVEKISKILERNISNPEEINPKIVQAIGYLAFASKKEMQGLIFSNSKYHQIFKDRIDVIDSFKIMKLFVSDAIWYKTRNKLENFNDYKNELISFSENNTINKLSNQVKVIEECINRLIMNCNTNLVIDFFNINIGGTND